MNGIYVVMHTKPDIYKELVEVPYYVHMILMVYCIYCMSINLKQCYGS